MKKKLLLSLAAIVAATSIGFGVIPTDRNKMSELTPDCDTLRFVNQEYEFDNKMQFLTIWCFPQPVKTNAKLLAWNPVSSRVTNMGLGTGLSISGGSLMTADNSPSNEFQTLSYSSGLLSLSNGNSVSLPTPSGTILSAPTAISAGARTINTGYRVSTTKESEISVNATANVSIGVLGNVTATVFIEVSPDNATWTRVGQATKNSGSLVGLNTGNGGCFRYRLPVGYYWRWVTVTSATGVGNTATFSYDGGSEQVYN